MRHLDIALLLTAVLLFSLAPSVSAEEPHLVGSIDTSSCPATGFSRGVFVAGASAYVAGCGIEIVDVGNPQTPIKTGKYSLPAGVSVSDVFLSGDYAYAAADSRGLVIMDISDPQNPVQVGALNLGDLAAGVAVSGSYAYVAAMSSGLFVIDISNPRSPRTVKKLNTSPAGGPPVLVESVSIYGSQAYLATMGGGLQVIDISDPANPTVKASLLYAQDYHSIFPIGAAVRSSYAFVTGMDGLEVLDISDLSSPVLKASVPITTLYGCERVFLSGPYAYVTGSNTGMLYIVDVSAYAAMPKPMVAVSTNRAQYRPGDTMTVTLSTMPGTSDNTWDIYVALLLPNGVPVFMSYAPAYAFDLSLIPARPLAPITASSQQIFSLVIPDGFPLGNWAWVSILAKPDFSDFSELSLRSFTTIATPPPSADVSGVWLGTWTSGTGYSGSFAANVVQQGSSLSGTIDAPFIGLLGVPLKGTVDGNQMTFGDVSDQITFTGTVTGGTTAAGTYVYPAIQDSGAWQAAKQGTPGACPDISGSWSFTETVTSTTFGDASSRTSLAMITQTGCSISVQLGGGALAGAISWSAISWAGSFARDGGTVTVNSVDVSLSGTGTLSGTTSWTWSNGNYTCSGTTTVEGVRL